MKLARDQRGIAHLVMVLIVVAVVAAVGFVGYRVASDSRGGAGTSNASAKQVAVPKQIKTKADLSQASKSLDSLPIDNGVNPNSLNNDLNAIR